MRILPVLAAILLTALVQPVLAAPFDGHWFADIPAQEKCNAISTMDLLVADGIISGQIHNPANVVAVTGKVDADGNATFTAMERYPGTMKFSGDRFEATWFNGGCDRHAQGNRAPEPAQLGAIAAERERHQDSYAELVRRAAAGEKVDFTLLRGEFVYSEDWEFYGNKSNGLMTQALAAQKGKDCPGAVEQADQVLKLDFTFAQAHAIKAECLEDSDRARSRIESAIADGLDDSLMNSGDGDSEKTAYVVSSMHEEMRALAKRGIQLKTRATEVRGSDGHYYDQVQGIAIRSNWYGNGINLSGRTVFFNVDSFVKGRESRRAAVAVAAATVH
jgi:hypothetical protein